MKPIQQLIIIIMKGIKKSTSDSQDDSDNELIVNTDNSPKPIPICKLGSHIKTKKIVINVSDTQYPIVSEIAEELGWTIQQNEGIGDWDIWWTDREIYPDVLYRMNLHQKINHFPGIYVLARKNMLGLHLMGMKEYFPEEYNFFPSTWVIPFQFAQFRQYFQSAEANSLTYIVKPQALSQGRGIFLTKNIDEIINGNKYVIQTYIPNPLLIDGLKFDLRIYVLIAGTDPLRLYVYEEGLTRLATQKYENPTQQNMHKSYIHLTNYSLNKSNPNYIFNNSSKAMDIGHKRTLKSTYQYLKKNGYDIEKVKNQINDAIVKTVISGLPLIKHQYQYCQPQELEGNMCFHILGFDVMLTSELKAIIIEVNHTPSFETSTPLDYYVKKNLIIDTLKLMRINQKNKKILYDKAKLLVKRRIEKGKRQILKGEIRKQQILKQKLQRDQFQAHQLGGYRTIHPCENPIQQSLYDKYFQHAQKVTKQCQKTRKQILREQFLKPPKTSRKNQVLTKPNIYHPEESLINSLSKHPSFRTKVSKSRNPNCESPLSNFHQIMNKFTTSKDFTQQPNSFKIHEDLANFTNLRKLVLEKKTISHGETVEKRHGSYLVPKNYSIAAEPKIFEISKQKLLGLKGSTNMNNVVKNSVLYIRNTQKRRVSLF